MSTLFSKWVACWGTATSISDRTEATYAKELTLRYPYRICFSGNKLRFHFSNLTGTEPVTLASVTVLKDENFYPVTLNGNASITIEPGTEQVSDELSIELNAGDEIDLSIYLENFTQLNAGTLVTGPLSSGKYSYGNFSNEKTLPDDLTRNTNWYYFINTIDIYTEEKNHALICYGDSITAQSWPDYLSIRASEAGFSNVSIIRRAVCGTRILRQYNCTTYAAYGLKGATRFPIEMNTAGADTVIVQHGINDIIHPVGIEVNKFRPWEDMPSVEDLIIGFKSIYIDYARANNFKIYGGTLLPIEGWRTYAPFRDEIRTEFNNWLKTTSDLDGCVDFDSAVRNPLHPSAFKEGFDSGDHLHPSEQAYKAMAYAVPESLLQ